MHDRLKNRADRTEGGHSKKRRDSVAVGLEKFQTDIFFIKKIKKQIATDRPIEC